MVTHEKFMIQRYLTLAALATAWHAASLSIEHQLMDLSASLRELSVALSTGKSKKGERYTIECIPSSKNHDEPIKKEDLDVVTRIIKNGEILCSIRYFQWFGFPYYTPEIIERSTEDKVRSGVFRRVLGRKTGSKPRADDLASLYDYLFLIRDAGAVVAIVDGLLTSQRNFYPCLNVLADDKALKEKGLGEMILSTINQAIDIYVNNSRDRDKEAVEKPLQFTIQGDMDDAEQLINYLKENNTYAKNGVITLSSEKILNTAIQGVTITVGRNKSDAKKKPDKITCLTQ